MAVTVKSKTQIITRTGNGWGFVVLGNEAYVGTYDSNTISVFNLDTKQFVRSFNVAGITLANWYYNPFIYKQDDTSLYIFDKTATNKYYSIDKTTGTTLQTFTSMTLPLGSSHYINSSRDLLLNHDYTGGKIYFRKNTDNSLLYSLDLTSIISASRIMSVYIYKDKFLFVQTGIGSKYELFVASFDYGSIASLTVSNFSKVADFTSDALVGLGFYNNKLYSFHYGSENIFEIELDGLYSLKYLLKQNSNYYTIKTANYDSTTTHNFIPLTLTGGTNPNKNDIDALGFNDLSALTNSMTVSSDIFIPVSKFDNTAELKMYKG
jgi:DNA-binding beta-propeller fold protein YncE